MEGVEPSLAMTKCARLKTGVKIFDLAAEQDAFVEEYNGIWPMRPSMHMHKDAFFDTVPRVVKLLKPGGYFF